MVQYVSPFSSVKIATMAAAFGATEAAMLKEVEGLLLDKQIKGRIDLVDGVSLSATGTPSPRLLLLPLRFQGFTVNFLSG